jgi:membrane protein DedA with SNARE-associated domain
VTLAALFGNHELNHLLSTYGYAVVFLIVGAESLGIPLPGETTLTLAAIYAGSTHRLNIVGVIAAAAAGAIIGDNIGYLIGRSGGYRLLRRYGHYVRVDEHRLKIGRYLFDRHGGKVVFFGRFVSILRTYAAFLAGTLKMHWRRFLVFNAAGGILWATIFGVGFYYFGSALKALRAPLDIAIGVVATLALVERPRRPRPTNGYVAKADNRGWSPYGAPWMQPVAIRGKSAGP